MAETLGVPPQATADVTQGTTLTGHRGWASAVAISPDGSWLAIAGDDRTVRISDASTGHALARLAWRVPQTDLPSTSSARPARWPCPGRWSLAAW